MTHSADFSLGRNRPNIGVEEEREPTSIRVKTNGPVSYDAPPSPQETQPLLGEAEDGLLKKANAVAMDRSAVACLMLQHTSR